MKGGVWRMLIGTNLRTEGQGMIKLRTGVEFK